MNSEQAIALSEKYGAHNYHPLPVVISRAEGVWVWDPEGNRYLDMLASYSALNQGHRHPRIIQAMIEQAGRVTLTSRAFHNVRMAELLERLAEVTGFEMALLMNTGAEAVETAIKAARKWGYKVKGVPPERAEIIVCRDNFHGRTTTIVGFSTDEQVKDGFGPFAPGFKVIDFGEAEQLEDAITKNTVAFLVEPVQGEAGVILPPAGYLREARRICSERNVLLAVDEIQTGFGRTGKLFAFEHDGVRPDMMTVGKALGGGLLPISAALSSKEVMGVFRPGDHGSTFGGNPLACAVALASMDVILEERLPEKSRELGAYFLDRLRKLNSPLIKEVRGKGLFIGVELHPEAGTARDFCEAFMKAGLLAKDTHKQVVRFAPPLVITREEIDWSLERLSPILTAEKPPK